MESQAGSGSPAIASTYSDSEISFGSHGPSKPNTPNPSRNEVEEIKVHSPKPHPSYGMHLDIGKLNITPQSKITSTFQSSPYSSNRRLIFYADDIPFAHPSTQAPSTAQESVPSTGIEGNSLSPIKNSVPTSHVPLSESEEIVHVQDCSSNQNVTSEFDLDETGVNVPLSDGDLSRLAKDLLEDTSIDETYYSIINDTANLETPESQPTEFELGQNNAMSTGASLNFHEILQDPLKASEFPNKTADIIKESESTSQDSTMETSHTGNERFNPETSQASSADTSSKTISSNVAGDSINDRKVESISPSHVGHDQSQVAEESQSRGFGLSESDLLEETFEAKEAKELQGVCPNAQEVDISVPQEIIQDVVSELVSEIVSSSQENNDDISNLNNKLISEELESVRSNKENQDVYKNDNSILSDEQIKNAAFPKTSYGLDDSDLLDDDLTTSGRSEGLIATGTVNLNVSRENLEDDAQKAKAEFYSENIKESGNEELLSPANDAFSNFSTKNTEESFNSLKEFGDNETKCDHQTTYINSDLPSSMSPEIDSKERISSENNDFGNDEYSSEIFYNEPNNILTMESGRTTKFQDSPTLRDPDGLFCDQVSDVEAAIEEAIMSSSDSSLVDVVANFDVENVNNCGENITNITEEITTDRAQNLVKENILFSSIKETILQEAMIETNEIKVEAVREVDFCETVERNTQETVSKMAEAQNQNLQNYCKAEMEQEAAHQDDSTHIISENILNYPVIDMENEANQDSNANTLEGVDTSEAQNEIPQAYPSKNESFKYFDAIETENNISRECSFTFETVEETVQDTKMPHLKVDKDITEVIITTETEPKGPSINVDLVHKETLCEVIMSQAKEAETTDTYTSEETEPQAKVPEIDKNSADINFKKETSQEANVAQEQQAIVVSMEATEETAYEANKSQAFETTFNKSDNVPTDEVIQGADFNLNEKEAANAHEQEATHEVDRKLDIKADRSQSTEEADVLKKDILEKGGEASPENCAVHIEQETAKTDLIEEKVDKAVPMNITARTVKEGVQENDQLQSEKGFLGAVANLSEIEPVAEPNTFPTTDKVDISEVEDVCEGSKEFDRKNLGNLDDSSVEVLMEQIKEQLDDTEGFIDEQGTQDILDKSQHLFEVIMDDVVGELSEHDSLIEDEAEPFLECASEVAISDNVNDTGATNPTSLTTEGNEFIKSSTSELEDSKSISVEVPMFETAREGILVSKEIEYTDNSNTSEASDTTRSKVVTDTTSTSLSDTTSTDAVEYTQATAIIPDKVPNQVDAAKTGILEIQAGDGGITTSTPTEVNEVEVTPLQPTVSPINTIPEESYGEGNRRNSKEGKHVSFAPNIVTSPSAARNVTSTPGKRESLGILSPSILKNINNDSLFMGSPMTPNHMVEGAAASMLALKNDPVTKTKATVKTGFTPNFKEITPVKRRPDRLHVLSQPKHPPKNILTSPASKTLPARPSKSVSHPRYSTVMAPVRDNSNKSVSAPAFSSLRNKISSPRSKVSPGEKPWIPPSPRPHLSTTPSPMTPSQKNTTPGPMTPSQKNTTPGPMTPSQKNTANKENTPIKTAPCDGRDSTHKFKPRQMPKLTDTIKTPPRVLAKESRTNKHTFRVPKPAGTLLKDENTKPPRCTTLSSQRSTRPLASKPLTQTKSGGAGGRSKPLSVKRDTRKPVLGSIENRSSSVTQPKKDATSDASKSTDTLVTEKPKASRVPGKSRIPAPKSRIPAPKSKLPTRK